MFYDGQVRVVDNVAEVQYAHHRDALLMRGFEEVVEVEQEEPQPKQDAQVVSAQEPRSGSKTRKKVSNE